MRGGGFGYPPNIFQIIYIGPHRIGIEVINYYTGQGETSEGIAILIPWKGKINEALIAMRSDENSDGCGKDADNFPCYSNKTTMALVPGENSEYFDIVLKRSGTDVTDHEPYKAKPIHGYERLSLADGYYKIVQQAGVSASIDPK